MASSHPFSTEARAALSNRTLQAALGDLEGGLVARRRRAIEDLPEFEALRSAASDIRAHTLDHLDHYLEAFEASALRAGSEVHWARDAHEARRITLDICRKAGARLVAKGKSMVSEEIELNQHLEAAGIEVVETDLGEYLLQIRGETPSHIIAPAIHLTQMEVEADFRRHHRHLPPERGLARAEDLVQEARVVLREKFLQADVGITGANFLVAETGSAVVVTNEGNGDLTMTLPRVHIVIASLEKVVPTLEDAVCLLRVLARSATGQEMSAYTTFATGPRRAGEPDGPQAVHVILLDNGRSEMLRGPMRAMLKCIRCGACLNHCPVYRTIGGHAYGSVYPGPMGSVLSPAIGGIERHRDLPNASTFCGRCETVCPVKIPLVGLLRAWRVKEHDLGRSPVSQRVGLRAWAFLARRPRLYRIAMRIVAATLAILARRKGHLGWLPLAGGWTAVRDFPAPEGPTFQDVWRKRRPKDVS